MLINNRLSTILTQHAGEMAFVQRSQYKALRSFGLPCWVVFSVDVDNFIIFLAL